jgi:hypothetical protein
VRLPWDDQAFELVIVSTVFSSILDPFAREKIAAEIDRVIVSGGVLVWYDLAFDNPRNTNVKGVRPREIKKLFPGYLMSARSVTLAPPVARRVVPLSVTFATVLAALPLLRTHIAAVLQKR